MKALCKFITKIFLLFVLTLEAQVNVSVSTGVKYLEMGNILMARDIFKKLVAMGKVTPEVLYYLSYCYVFLGTNTKETIELLKEYLNQAKNIDNNVYYLLGRAYHLQNQFDSAIIYYRIFIKGGGGRVATRAKAELDIQQALVGRELVKYPVKVKITEMPFPINTEFPEYMPYVNKTEDFILFNARREDGSLLMPDGYPASNIYYAILNKGNVLKVQPVGIEINTPENNEEIVGMSSLGNYIIIRLQEKSGGDLFLSKLIDKSDIRLKFSTPIPFPPPINSPYNEISAAISDDGSFLIFSSDRPDGFGSLDLYIVKKLPNEEWSKPANMGPHINTKYEDNFPVLWHDGKTLFFSSQGHISMGGLDIFRATYNENSGTWENVRNIGYPINTPYDDIVLSISPNGRKGYMSRISPGNDYDINIYQITFLEAEPSYAVVFGKIFTKDTLHKIEDVKITATNSTTGELVGYYTPNPLSMKYIMILSAGKYDISVEAPKFQNKHFALNIEESDALVEKEINIELVP